MKEFDQINDKSMQIFFFINECSKGYQVFAINSGKQFLIHNSQLQINFKTDTYTSLQTFHGLSLWNIIFHLPRCIFTKFYLQCCLDTTISHPKYCYSQITPINQVLPIKTTDSGIISTASLINFKFVCLFWKEQEEDKITEGELTTKLIFSI